MPGPKLGCGGTGQPACPPENAAGVYTPDQMAEHGHLNYHKGIKDTIAKINAVLDDPGPAWGLSELAYALRRALGE